MVEVKACFNRVAFALMEAFFELELQKWQNLEDSVCFVCVRDRGEGGLGELELLKREHTAYFSFNEITGNLNLKS
ncbi:hypothetical protein L6452_36591 [Arctium lappa]|uniref:Uncharacterized protein n=1 Tax=Arctium lappa TaxID=4217 RepID=A0ACB8YB45_ARCLA|nr:hypothetical protein L6452_36591 [Arctium lappa]